MPTIYPPIVPTFMPAFDVSQESVRLYFALSPYNSRNDLGTAQITVRYQSNNANATNQIDKIIKGLTINQETPESNKEIAATAYRYYININNTMIKNGFESDILYKVQIRFTSSTSTSGSIYSQWSTVCLLKPIDKPNFGIISFDDPEKINTGATNQTTTRTVATLQPDFVGFYAPQTSNETLKYWRMQLFDSSGSILLADTDQQTINSYEQASGRVAFTGHLPYVMVDGETYIIRLFIETKNGYTAVTFDDQHTFIARPNTSESVYADISLEMNYDDGYAKVIVEGKGGVVVHTNLTLRRTSSKSNFEIWEDLSTKAFENSLLYWQFDDFTIEAGVFYQYGVQNRDNRGRRSPLIKTDKELADFEDAFLLQKSGSIQEAIQLKIKYDMNISNSLVNIGQSKTDTIGSKYPFIRRNGNMYYHSFPFSFLITAYTDNNHLFATEKQLKDDQIDNYAITRGDYILSVETGMYDHIYEREFRRKVEQFLYNDKVKLFRSETEGNMLIKLMNITLTPKQELGRLLYSVDATAIEIDEPTLEKFDFYGIQTIGDYSSNIIFGESLIGQLNRIRLNKEDIIIQIQQITFFDNQPENPKEYDAFNSNNNTFIYYQEKWNLANFVPQTNPEESFYIITKTETIEDPYPANFNLMGTTESDILTIPEKYHLGKTINRIKVESLYLSYLRIQIDSKPYLIQNVNGVLTPFEGTDTSNQDLMLGTLIDIGDARILIEYPNTIYEVKGDNVRIDTSWKITPLKDTKMLVDYVVNLSESIDETGVVASTLIYEQKVGQLIGQFKSRESLITTIKYKYYLDLYDESADQQNSNAYYLKVSNLYNLNFQADPGTVFYAQTNSDTKIRRFVIDESGQLFIDPDQSDGYIDKAYFYGITIEKREITNLENDEISTEQPEFPVELNAFSQGNKYYVFHNGKWYPAEEQNNGDFDIACPVSAYVYYYIQTQQGFY